MIVFDSSVWISAFQFGGLPLAALQRAFIAKELVDNSDIRAEVERILVTKFGWRMADVREVMDQYLADTPKIEADGILRGVCRDADDDYILECAIRANATCIITGDKDLLTMSPFRGIRVLTVREYLGLS